MYLPNLAILCSSIVLGVSETSTDTTDVGITEWQNYRYTSDDEVSSDPIPFKNSKKRVPVQPSKREKLVSFVKKKKNEMVKRLQIGTSKIFPTNTKIKYYNKYKKLVEKLPTRIQKSMIIQYPITKGISIKKAYRYRLDNLFESSLDHLTKLGEHEDQSDKEASTLSNFSSAISIITEDSNNTQTEESSIDLSDHKITIDSSLSFIRPKDGNDKSIETYEKMYAEDTGMPYDELTEPKFTYSSLYRARNSTRLLRGNMNSHARNLCNPESKKRQCFYYDPRYIYWPKQPSIIITGSVRVFSHSQPLAYKNNSGYIIPIVADSAPVYYRLKKKLQDPSMINYFDRKHKAELSATVSRQYPAYKKKHIPYILKLCYLKGDKKYTIESYVNSLWKIMSKARKA